MYRYSCRTRSSTFIVIILVFATFYVHVLHVMCLVPFNVTGSQLSKATLADDVGHREDECYMFFLFLLLFVFSIELSTHALGSHIISDYVEYFYSQKDI